MTASPTRWLFADQLGPRFLDDKDQPVVLIESRAVLRRRRFHRQMAHLVLSALRHRAAQLGARAQYRQTDTYRAALASIGQPLEVCAPTSYAARRFVGQHDNITVLPPRGFITSQQQFDSWARRQAPRRLLLADFYRDARRRDDVLMDGGEPVGGQWNFDYDNRRPPPKTPVLGVPEPWRATKDEIDEEVRADLDRWEAAGDVTFVGSDGPRWASATRMEAVAALDRFITARLATFGPWEDAMLTADPVLSHSVLPRALNLGLLDPMECVRAAEAAFRAGRVRIASAEGDIRQLLGWRDYVWHIYWHTGPACRSRHALGATAPLPEWLWDLDATDVHAELPACCCSACAPVGLDSPHRAADGARQLRAATRTRPRRADRLVPHQLRRRLRLGDAAQRGRHEPVRRWRVDGHQAVCGRRRLPQPDERLLRRVPVRPRRAGRARRLPVHLRLLGFPGPQLLQLAATSALSLIPFLLAAGYALNPRLRQPLAGLRWLSDREAVVAQEAARGGDPP